LLKKASGSQGKGVLKVDNRTNLEDIEDLLDQNSPLIIQEFLAHTKGRDIRAFVIGGVVVGSMMRIATKGFKSNIHRGGKAKPVKLDPQVTWLVLETVKLTGLDIAGVDLLIDKDNYKICEVNSAPGFEGLERAIGVDIAASMLEFIKLRLGVWRMRAPSTKSAKKIAISIPIQDEHQEGSQIPDTLRDGSQITDSLKEQ